MLIFERKKPVFESVMEEGKYQLVWRLSILFVFLFTILTSLVITFNPPSGLFYFVITLISMSCFLYIQLTGKYKLVYWTFSLTSSIIIPISIYVLIDLLHYSDFLWATSTVVFAFIGLGLRIGFYFLILNLTTLISFFLFGINTHIDHLRTLTIYERIGSALEITAAFFALIYLLYIYIRVHKVTESKLVEANNKLKVKNEENIILLKEIHHRIKNNLQIVISLLRMQKDEMNEPKLEIQFNEAIRRIMSISLIHEKLYQKDNLEKFDFVSYINDLVSEIKSLQYTQKELNIDLNIGIQQVGLKTVVPLGLILNELITNSFKHSRESNESKEISIEIKLLKNGIIQFNYKDSGEWIQSKNKGFGLELIDVLVQQMDGEYTRFQGNYTFYLANLDLN